MLARAVRKPVTSEAFRTASREPSGENRRREPLGEVFFDSGDVSRETILTEEEEEAKVGMIRVVADAGWECLNDCRGGRRMVSSPRALAKALRMSRICEALREDRREEMSSLLRMSILAVLVLPELRLVFGTK